MSNQDIGPPLYPEDVFYDERRIGSNPGARLRDYFAAHAPAYIYQTTLSKERIWDLIGRDERNGAASDHETELAYAVLRYQYADAMLKARLR